MPKAKQKTKTYTIQVIATVEVTATIEMEGYSEKDALERAEDQFENNLDFSAFSFENLDYGVQSIDSEITEEE